ncbi:propionyl-CoA synthetase [Dermacoccaceae bacterium W4C1]
MDGNDAYRDLHQRSLKDPAGFWAEAARDISWVRPPTVTLEESSPPFYRWFADGQLNVCYNALDRHVVAGHADRTALIYDSPVTESRQQYTYAELLDLVSRCAGVLTSLGVQPGDRVVIYMPMIPEAVISMLACARIGAVHSVVFGGFAAPELAARIDDARPRVILSASAGVERTRVIPYKPLLDAALELAEHQVERCVVVQREQCVADLGERDLDWAQVMRPGTVEPAAVVPVESTHPLYVLYTSGTTGSPKGVVRDSGGYAVAMQWSMTHIYGMQPGQTWFTASDVGWVVGHSYIVYAPLIAGCATVLYEGKPVGTPDAGAFWRIVQDYGVQGLFTAPTAIRAIKKEDPDGELVKDYDLSTLRNLFLAGERLDPGTWEWATEKLGIPVVDNWWQTETGWPIAANPVGTQEYPIKPGSATLPSPGYDIQILDPEGSPLPAGTEGAVCLKLPLPPGTLTTLWENDERYVSSYLSAFEGYYSSGDGGYLDEDGYVWIMGRTDDVLNVAGHRLSTGSLEAALSGHPAVAECAVIGVRDDLKGQVPRGFVVLKGAAELSEQDRAQVVDELLTRVREQVGAVASLRQVDVVGALPKTRSGKILRRTMRQIADGDDAPVPGTIEDASVLETLSPVLRGGSS